MSLTCWICCDDTPDGRRVGLCPIVFKSMHCDTAPMAYFVQQIVGECARQKDEETRGFGCCGGVVLSWAAGGINPTAV